MSFGVGGISDCNAVAILDPLDSKKPCVYTRVFNAVMVELQGHRLSQSFEHWNISSPQALQKVFGCAEIKAINKILQRYLLLRLGPSNLEKDLNLLGVSTIGQILSPNNSIYTTLEKLFVRTQPCPPRYR
ncbi:MAG: hypothetical protein JSR37_03590 [Verrucomicrobia bacterium]|nr:hypothetical protein [Verrucomicrobiota bacterium]MBS0637726.1 hypothetical protein [Verrucomicrobiota bacterium]